MSEDIRIGVIGAGRIGKVHIENLLKDITGAALKVVADVIITEDLKKWCAQMGVPQLVNDPEEVFNDEKIDAVIIASSTDTHAEFIQKAARAQKQIFCEKPIDTDIQRIKETLKIVEEEGVKLMVGFNRRFDHNFARLHEAVTSGNIGEPHIIKITARDPSPPPIEYIKVSGGIFLDMTIHDWDMARFLAGSEVKEVYANGAVLIDPDIGQAGDIDTAVATLQFENGALGIIDNSRQAVYGYDQRAEVFGSKGCARADNDTPNTVEVYTAEQTQKDKIPYFFLERYMESYATEIQKFIDCIKHNKDPKPDGWDGLQNVVVAKAAQKSFDENRPVKLSEITKL
ncbi:MAG: inositol 2-dehydrogenase [Promethearchaeia archaeon]